MIKRIRSVAIVATLFLSSTSCMITASHTVLVTSNPVGSKKGVVTGNWKKPSGGMNDAMKNGRITKVGIVEHKQRYLYLVIFALPRTQTVVTGE
jgi:hypothetical protein